MENEDNKKSGEFLVNLRPRVSVSCGVSNEDRTHGESQANDKGMEDDTSLKDANAQDLPHGILVDRVSVLFVTRLFIFRELVREATFARHFNVCTMRRMCDIEARSFVGIMGPQTLTTKVGGAGSVGDQFGEEDAKDADHGDCWSPVVFRPPARALESRCLFVRREGLDARSSQAWR
jgi:hypothetical protein